MHNHDSGYPYKLRTDTVKSESFSHLCSNTNQADISENL